MKANLMTAIGIDIDGTITLDPAFFSSFARDCRNQGITVHIVSARPPDSREETEAELRELEMTYDELYLLPPIEDAITLCPHSELEWFHRHFWLKVDYALRCGLSHFVDDNERVLQLFQTYAPEICAIPALDRHRLRPLVGR